MRKIINGLTAHMAGNRAYRDTLRELNNLTDRDLGDIGILRGDVRGIAAEAGDAAYRAKLTEIEGRVSPEGSAVAAR